MFDPKIEHASPSAFEHPGSPRALEKGDLNRLERLGGWSTLEQGPRAYSNILATRVRSSMLEHLGSFEQREHGCPFARACQAKVYAQHYWRISESLTFNSPVPSFPTPNKSKRLRLLDQNFFLHTSPARHSRSDPPTTSSAPHHPSRATPLLRTASQSDFTSSSNLANYFHDETPRLPTSSTAKGHLGDRLLR